MKNKIKLTLLIGTIGALSGCGMLYPNQRNYVYPSAIGLSESIRVPTGQKFLAVYSHAKGSILYPCVLAGNSYLWKSAPKSELLNLSGVPELSLVGDQLQSVKGNAALSGKVIGTGFNGKGNLPLLLIKMDHFEDGVFLKDRNLAQPASNYANGGAGNNMGTNILSGNSTTEISEFNAKNLSNMSDITYIQRLNTVGGMPPDEACSIKTTEINKIVYYTADYAFYKDNRIFAYPSSRWGR